MAVFTLNQIQLLTGSNYKRWKEQVELYLGLNHNLDICLIEDKPATPTLTSTKDQREFFDKWVRANRMTINVLKATMSDTVRGSIPEKDLAVQYMAAIAEKYKENDKAEASQLMHTFDNMKYNGSGNVREHIMKMIDIAAKLKDLKMTLADEYIVQHALNSLPSSFSQLKTSYLAQKDKWSLDELISICTQDENRMKKEREITVNLVGKPKWKNNNKLKAKRTNGAAIVKPQSVQKKPFQFKCYFCKKPGHMKKDCNGYKSWVVKRGVHKEEGTKE